MTDFDQCLIVAEAGINHDGDPEKLMKLARVAKLAGADALKVQCFSADCFVGDGATWHGESQRDLFRRHELPREAFVRVAEECRRLGLHFFGTPDCKEHAQWLVDAGSVYLKVGSDDLTNTPLIRDLAAFGLPLMISTGMGEWYEVCEAKLAAFPIAPILMYCASVYPANLSHLRFQRMEKLNLISEIVGFSDHTRDSTAALIAVTLGAKVVEKHLTASPSHELDHVWSASAQEFRQMVQDIRALEKSLNSNQLSEDETRMRVTARRSIVASRDLIRGRELTREDVAFLRPGDGLYPSQLGSLLGGHLTRDVRKGENLRMGDVLGEEDIFASVS